MLANRFLKIIAVLIVLVLGAAFVWRIFGTDLMRLALVPTVSFEESATAPEADYRETASWIAHPGLATDPSRANPKSPPVPPETAVATFYVTPTAYLSRSSWNAPFDDSATNERLDLFTKGQGSVFAVAGPVWSPRYRQATFGAFLTAKPEGAKALNLAYGDVLRAFDTFLAAQPADSPIILAGHSQGSLHLLRLLRERVAGQPLAARVVAAYVAGWPVSLGADIPALGLPACTVPAQSGCILSWQSFAEPADPTLVIEGYEATPGFTGLSRKGTPMLCSNPMTGKPGDTATADRNLGALVPGSEPGTATLSPRLVPAACDARGFLLIGAPPEGFGQYVLPGNNYHVYDYALFWMNLRADVAARVRGHAVLSAR